MESIIGEWVPLVSYLSLGVLFFFVIWSMLEDIMRDIFANVNISRLLAFLIATYGFWYPLMPAFRILYLILLSATAIVGTGLSRLLIVAKWAGTSRYIIIVLGLISFEVVQYVTLTLIRVSSPYGLVADLISWGILVYGITIDVRKELVEPIIVNMKLPRTNFIQAAFVLASVIFLPIEFPIIDVLISLVAIFITIIGGYYFGKRVN